jgi:hypothetical protein
MARRGDGELCGWKSSTCPFSPVQNEQVEDYSRTRREFESASIEFLLTDLDVANTLLDVASTSHDPETRRRNIQNAKSAYETVIQFALRLSLTESDRATIETQLGLLKQRLVAAGA